MESAPQEMLEVVAGHREWAVLHGDCLHLMAQLPPECATMIWTDPPYGHCNADGDLLSRRHEFM